MAEPLQFQLNLTGTFAQGMAAPNAALQTFQGNLKGAAIALPGFEKQFSDGLKKMRGQVDTFLTFDLVGAARLAYDAVARIGMAFVGVGKSITHVLGDFQDLQLAMKLNLGDEGANMLQGIADSFGGSRFDDDLINKALIPFAEMGVKDEVLLDRIATAAGDLSARLNTGDQGFLEYTDALRKIALKGEVDSKALKALQIGEADYYKNLGGFLKVTAKQAEELAKKGKIDSEVLISTALHEVARREGGQLGSGTNAAGQTLGGTLARLGNLPGNIFKQLDGGQAAKSIQSMLDNLIDFGQGEGGKSIVKFLDRTITGGLELAGSFGRITGGLAPFGRAVSAVFGGLIDGFSSVAAGFGALNLGPPGALIEGFGSLVGSTFRTVGFVIGGTVKALVEFNNALERDFAAIGDFFGGLWQSYMGYFDFVVESFSSLGRDIVDGVVGGILERWEGAKERVAGVWSGMIGDAKDVLGIKSPSIVFQQIGGYTAEGMALGLEAGRGRVASAAEQSLSDTVFGGLRQLPSGGEASASIAAGGGLPAIEIYYQAAEGRSSVEDARDMAREIRDELERFFVEGT